VFGKLKSCAMLRYMVEAVFGSSKVEMNNLQLVKPKSRMVQWRKDLMGFGSWIVDSTKNIRSRSGPTQALLQIRTGLEDEACMEVR
jgi:hypothetical protein